MMNVLRSKRGFTLLELILVIAIIALLAGVVAPRFMSQMPKAEIASTKAQLENLRSSVGVFRTEQGRYPGSLQELTQRPTVQEPYMRKIPQPKVKNAQGMSGSWIYSSQTGDVKLNLSGVDVNGEPFTSY